MEVRTGWSQGQGVISQSPNGVVFIQGNCHLFEKMAAKIREMTAAAHGAGTAVGPQAAPASGPSIPEHVRSMSELYAAGILTGEEFTAKKAELLARK